MWAEEDVRGLDVPVDNGPEVVRRVIAAFIAIMDICEGFGELSKGVPSKGLRDCCAMFHVGVVEFLEVTARTILEKGKGVVGTNLKAVKTDDVLMTA